MIAASPETNNDGAIGVRIDGVGDGSAWRSRIMALPDGTTKTDNIQAPQIVVFSGSNVNKIATSLNADITLSLYNNKIRSNATARCTGKLLSGIFTTESAKAGDIVLTAYRDNGSISSATWYVECQKL